MNQITCPFCSKILEQGTVSIGKINGPVFQRGRQEPLYFNSNQNESKEIVRFFDEKPALYCHSCAITIINKSYSEVPIGLGQKAYAKNQLVKLKKLMSIFSSPDNFEEYIKFHDKTKFFQEYLNTWKSILSEETSDLLQAHFTTEYLHIKAFYCLLESVNSEDFETLNLYNTKNWILLNEMCLKS